MKKIVPVLVRESCGFEFQHQTMVYKHISFSITLYTGHPIPLFVIFLHATKIFSAAQNIMEYTQYSNFMSNLLFFKKKIY